MGDLTAEFPDDPPERKQPEIKNEFEHVVQTDDHVREAQARLEQLESQRATPDAHLDHTISGTVEQQVHENLSKKEEAEIRALQERMERHRERSRGSKKSQGR